MDQWPGGETNPIAEVLAMASAAEVPKPDLQRFRSASLEQLYVVANQPVAGATKSK